MTNALSKLTGNLACSHLLDRPQRLWILPTYRFWHSEENWELVSVPVAIGMGVLVVALGVSNLPLYAVAVVPGVALILGLGLLERYIRRQAKARRALLDGGATSTETHGRRGDL